MPQDGSNQVLHFQELARVTVPAMGIGQEWNTVLDWQARQHAAFSGKPSYRVDVFNTIHQSFSDLCEGFQVMRDYTIIDDDLLSLILGDICDPFTPTTEVHRLANQYTIAFLKKNLAGESGYQRILTPGWALTREPYIEFFVTEKKSPRSIKDDWPDLFIYFAHQPGSEQFLAEKNSKKPLPIPKMGFPQQ